MIDFEKEINHKKHVSELVSIIIVLCIVVGLVFFKEFFLDKKNMQVVPQAAVELSAAEKIMKVIDNREIVELSKEEMKSKEEILRTLTR